MKKIIHINISKGENQYVAECSELPVVSQGKTLDEIVLNIKEAIELHLEDEDLSELGFLPKPVLNINFDMGELEYA